MKKMYLVAMLLGLFSMTAQAEKFGVNIDGKNIDINESSASSFSDGRVFHPTEMPKGIYVIAIQSMTSKDRLPNAEALIADRLKLAGFKVVDKMEDASIAIKFSTNSASLSMENADAKAKHSMFNAGQVSANAGAAIGAAVGGGAAGVIGFVVGGLYTVDSKSILNGEILINPILNKGLFGSSITSITPGGVIMNGVSVHYNLEKDAEAGDDTVLKMMVDQWIKNFLAV
jgi:hypothetical protein